MEYLQFEAQDGIGVITLNRPKALNALNGGLVDQLAALLQEQAGADLRALVLTGSGDRAFAAGADISEMADMTPAQACAFAARGQAAFRLLETFPAPTIAAVNGFALGGGCELAMACDIVLASPSAVFGQPEVKLGVIPGFGGTQRLVRRLGRQQALELMWTGRNLKAGDAVAAGLALRVVEDESVVDAAVALATRIARNGPVAVRLVKRAVDEATAQTGQDGYVGEQELFGECFSTSDQSEGMNAFLDKRPALFTGE